MGRILIGILIAASISTLLAAQEPAKQITFGDKRDADPMVSPDGNHLAFASNRTGTFNLYLITFGQEGVLQLTQGKKDDRNPCWAADNKTIIFDSKRTGNGDLYQMTRDAGTGFLQLTDLEEVESNPWCSLKSNALLFAVGPKRLIKLHDKMDVAFAGDRNSAVSRQILGEGVTPRFSPDGKSIVFVSRRTKNKDIWRMNVDGALPTQLTTDPKDDEDPVYSPDGKNILFTSGRTGNQDLWVMNADGGNQRQLTSTPEDESSPCWSVGGFIYFVKSAESGKSTIWRIAAPK